MLVKNYDQLIINGQTVELQQKRRDLLDMLIAGVEAVNPYQAVSACIHEKILRCDSKILNLSNFNRIFVIGFGKASIGMTKAICDHIPVAKGIVIYHEQYTEVFPETIQVFIGTHPLPSKQNIKATDAAVNIMRTCGDRDLVLVLISGGGSALLCKPRVSLKDLRTVNELLLRSPATIQEVNTVRKHLSLVHGGQLVAECKGTVLSLIISDIVGDPVEFIASGPTAPDSTSFIDAKNVFEKYNILDKIPENVRRLMKLGCTGQISETLKKDNPVFERVHNCIIANNASACRAVKKKAEQLGYTASIVTTSLVGEARTIGRNVVSQIHNKPQKTVLISSGETTVSVQGPGRGGRNQELILGCAELIATTDIVMASFATDGKDGNSPAAGAIIDGFTMSKAVKKGLQPISFLKKNNSYEFFSILGDALITGPTGTNVMDICVVLR
ncbi:MAG: DUF4147 domain-containing protein [Candidatus Thermoplasmatota archaeon]